MSASPRCIVARGSCRCVATSRRDFSLIPASAPRIVVVVERGQGPTHLLEVGLGLRLLLVAELLAVVVTLVVVLVVVRRVLVRRRSARAP